LSMESVELSGAFGGVAAATGAPEAVARAALKRAAIVQRQNPPRWTDGPPASKFPATIMPSSGESGGRERAFKPAHPRLADQSRLLRRFAGRSRAKSRLRCGTARALTNAHLRAVPISNACLNGTGGPAAKLRPH